MDFKVKVVGVDGYAINVPEKSIGTKLIDKARSVAGKKIPAEKFWSFAYAVSADTECVITEKQARRSGCFEETNEVVVNVPNGYLNRYITREPLFLKQGENLDSIQFQQVLKKNWENKFFNVWRDYGFSDKIALPEG